MPVTKHEFPDESWREHEGLKLPPLPENVPLSQSMPVRVWFENNGKPVAYDISISAPLSDIIAAIDIEAQMDADEFSPDGIEMVHQWAERCSDVEKVVLAYTGRKYNFYALAPNVDIPSMQEMQREFGAIRHLFGKNNPSLSIFGEQQRGSWLFNRVDHYLVYDKRA
jgi:hypothetical protein